MKVLWHTVPLLIATGEAIPLRGLEGVPGLPGAPQDEAGLTRKFETSHVGGATCRTPPIPRSALEQRPFFSLIALEAQKSKIEALTN